MNNPFESIDARLRNIESLLLDIKHHPAEKIAEEDQLLTIKEASKFLNLSVQTVYGYVHRSEIPVCKVSKRLYFSKKELTEWVKSARKHTLAEASTIAENHLLKNRK